MQIRSIALIGALGAFGGFALWDYYSDDSRHLREVRELEKVAPDVQVPDCYPKHKLAKVFAGVTYADKRDGASLTSDVLRRGALTHDCIRGADNRGNVERFASVFGDEAIPLYEGILAQCKVDKLDLSPSACFALDALAKNGSRNAVAALDKVLTERTVMKDVWLGALHRLTHAPGWRTRAQLAEMVPAEKAWEAKELLIEAVREKRDPTARDALQKAFTAEDDPQEKGKLQAAILEIDNPGRCVVEDMGEGKDNICRYVCKDQQNQRMKVPKVGQTCPLVRDPPAPAVATSGVTGG
jgi:hypothetical protein